MNEKSLSIGEALPEFGPLRGTDGREHSSEDFRKAGIVVIVFSCNHCPYVQAYEERMIAFQKAYAPQGVQLVAINSNEIRNYPEDNFEEMVRRAEKQGFNFAYLRDEDQSVATAFGATHTPEFFVFSAGEGDPHKLLRYHGKLDDNYQNPAGVKRRYLQEAVEAILTGKPVAEPETHSIGCTIKWK